jgi:hypothetical protein
MMALHPIILFVTTDIYEKVKNTTIKVYSNDEKTDMTLINRECNKNASAVARLCRQKLFVFSEFRLTYRMTFMSKFTKLHS